MKGCICAFRSKAISIVFLCSSLLLPQVVDAKKRNPKKPKNPPQQVLSEDSIAAVEVEEISDPKQLKIYEDTTVLVLPRDRLDEKQLARRDHLLRGPKVKGKKKREKIPDDEWSPRQVAISMLRSCVDNEEQDPPCASSFAYTLANLCLRNALSPNIERGSPEEDEQYWYTQADRYYRIAIEGFYHDKPEAYERQGLVQVNLKKMKAAEGSLKKSIELGSESHLVYGQLGQIQAQFGQHDEAEEQFKLAIALNGEERAWQTGLINALWRNEKIDELISVAQSIKLDERETAVTMMLFHSYVNLERKTEADKVLEEAVASGNLRPEDLYSFGRYLVNQQEFSRALSVFQEGLRLHGKKGRDAALIHSRALLDRDLPDEAEALLEQVESIDGKRLKHGQKIEVVLQRAQIARMRFAPYEEQMALLNSIDAMNVVDPRQRMKMGEELSRMSDKIFDGPLAERAASFLEVILTDKIRPSKSALGWFVQYLAQNGRNKDSLHLLRTYAKFEGEDWLCMQRILEHRVAQGEQKEIFGEEPFAKMKEEDERARRVFWDLRGPAQAANNESKTLLTNLRHPNKWVSRLSPVEMIYSPAHTVLPSTFDKIEILPMKLAVIPTQSYLNRIPNCRRDDFAELSEWERKCRESLVGFSPKNLPRFILVVLIPIRYTGLDLVHMNFYQDGTRPTREFTLTYTVPVHVLEQFGYPKHYLPFTQEEWQFKEIPCGNKQFFWTKTDAGILEELLEPYDPPEPDGPVGDEIKAQLQAMQDIHDRWHAEFNALWQMRGSRADFDAAKLVASHHVLRMDMEDLDGKKVLRLSINPRVTQ